MSQAEDDRKPRDGPSGADRADGRVLPADVQEHLGRKLRTTLAAEADKPAFLGDSALPPRFESLIRQLEGTERPAQIGLEAVRRALEVPDGEAQADWQTGQKKVERPD